MPNRYTSLQITLHWLTFIMVVIAYGTMEFRWLAQRGSWQGFALIITHFSAGSIVLITMLLRLWLRLRHPTPKILPPSPRWQTGIAHLTHLCIYLLFIILPVFGLLSRYLKGRDWWLFGIPMPVAEVPNPALSTWLTGWHETIAPLGYWLIGLHAAAALLHHFIFKDNTLRRMLPSWRS